MIRAIPVRWVLKVQKVSRASREIQVRKVLKAYKESRDLREIPVALALKDHRACKASLDRKVSRDL